MGLMRRTSTKTRSMSLEVRSLFQGWQGTVKNDSISGSPFSNRRTMAGYAFRDVFLELTEGCLRAPQVISPVDGLRIQLDGIVMALAHLLQNVPHLMHPAARMLRLGIYRRNRNRQPRAAVRDGPLHVLSSQAAPKPTLYQALPECLALSLAARER